MTLDDFIIERLAAHHDRSAFDCRVEEFNSFLQKNTRQNADRDVGVTHVVVRSDDRTSICAYYTLVTRTVSAVDIPVKKVPPGEIGVVLLGRLAVDKQCQGQKLGRMLLLQAMAQTEKVSQVVGVFALVLHAKNESVRNWYLGLDYGFQQLLDDPDHLFIPVATIRKLGLTI